jgi:hypothetical protein
MRRGIKLASLALATTALAPGAAQTVNATSAPALNEPPSVARVAMLTPNGVFAPTALPTSCGFAVCQVKLTPEQMLKQAEQLVLARRFAEVKPLLGALSILPQFALQVNFMKGYIAVEQADYPTAIKIFRQILITHPEQTRVRLELARTLLITGKNAAAEHHFRLAAQDKNLPPEIAATITATRNLLRDRRVWSFSLDLGLAPDTNINNGTTVETIDANLGGSVIPLTLSGQQRAQTGIGEQAAASATLRLPLAKKAKLLIEADSSFTRYDDASFNDLTVQLAAGPEFKLSEASTLSIEALGNEHLYGGQSAATAEGARASYQRNLQGGQRIGVTVDARHTVSGFSNDYSGWQFASYFSYDRVVMRSMIASGSLYVRRDALNNPAYASLEVGGTLGIGGELPHGINAGISGGVSYAAYDEPLMLLANDSRRDWRFNTRVYVGLRSVRVAGFSPSITVTYNRNASNYALYDSQRTRVRFGLMRTF